MIQILNILECTDFNSQPHKEADRSAVEKHSMRHYFNSQPHKEADEALL